MGKIRDTSAIWWVRRDGHQMLVACLCFVSILMVSAYLGRWSFLASHVPPVQHTASATAPDDDELYTGLILFVPPRGDGCRLHQFNNRTGQIRDKGVVSCDNAMAGRAARPTESAMARVAAIRKGFRKD